MDTNSPATPASPATETPLWKGCTSQWTHFQFYVVAILVCLAFIALGILTPYHILAAGIVIPIIAMVGRYLVTKSVSYELSDQRLRITRGLLNVNVHDLELYRVKSYEMQESFSDRVLNLGNITLITADAITPTVVIRAVPQAKQVMDHLRQAVEAARDRKRVRQMDVDNLPGDDAGDLHAHS